MDSRKKRGKKVSCARCGSLNWDYQNCFNCLKPLSERKLSLAVFFKKGSYTYTRKERDFADDYANKNYKDLLQPTVYDNVSKKYVTNPEFVKEYGDPYKQQHFDTPDSGSDDDIPDMPDFDINTKEGLQ